MTPLVIFSDLDGTLLDHHDYSFDQALETLSHLKTHHIPCVLNTSKTYAELMTLNKALQLNAPFIIENGAAAYIPKNCHLLTEKDKAFNNQALNSVLSETEQLDHYVRKAFGPSRNKILQRLSELKADYHFTGFADMTVEDLINVTQLSESNARLALEREFTEPLLWQDSEDAFTEFQQILLKDGLQTQRGGRFTHIMGQQCDKALAMEWVSQVYQEYYQSTVTTMALGDGGNDVGMISKADIGIIIRSPVHAAPIIPNKPDVYITKGCGPVGWSQAIDKELKARRLI